jgi:hypothetical protein
MIVRLCTRAGHPEPEFVDLVHLRQLGLVHLDGRGRGARWSLAESSHE